jgi:hypothetical protein
MRARNSFKKGVRMKAEAEERLTSAEARAQMPVFAEEPPPSAKVTRLAAGVPQKAKPVISTAAIADVVPITAEVSPLAMYAKAINGAIDENDIVNSQEARDAAFLRGAALIPQKKAL